MRSRSKSALADLSAPTTEAAAADVPPVTDAASPATPVASPAAAPAAPGLVFLKPPPAGAKIPAPPAGSVAPNGGHYRTVVPWATELAALPGAVEDLRKFTRYSQVLGVTAPPYAQLLQALDVCGQWSTMRKETAAWDAYCQTQEGISWVTIRVMMDRLRPAFDLAAVGDPTLASTLPNLATMLAAKKAGAQKASATKRLNKQAVAEGKPPTHGAVGKRRQRAAEKAAAAAAKAVTPAPAQPAPAPAPQGNGGAGTTRG